MVALGLPETDVSACSTIGCATNRRRLSPTCAKYDLPDEVIGEITAYLSRYGNDSGQAGPRAAEDEAADI